jgi:hypothetical protein
LGMHADHLSTVDCVAMIHQWSPRGKRSQSLCLPARSVAHVRSGGGLGSAPHTAIRCGTAAIAAGEKRGRWDQRCHLRLSLCRQCDVRSGRGRHHLASRRLRAHLQSAHGASEPGERQSANRTTRLGTTNRRSG